MLALSVIKVKFDSPLTDIAHTDRFQQRASVYPMSVGKLCRSRLYTQHIHVAAPTVPALLNYSHHQEISWWPNLSGLEDLTGLNLHVISEQ